MDTAVQANVLPSIEQAVAAAQSDTRWKTQDCGIIKLGNGYTSQFAPPGAGMGDLNLGSGAELVDFYSKGKKTSTLNQGAHAKELAIDKTENAQYATERASPIAGNTS